MLHVDTEYMPLLSTRSPRCQSEETKEIENVIFEELKRYLSEPRTMLGFLLLWDSGSCILHLLLLGMR